MTRLRRAEVKPRLPTAEAPGLAIALGGVGTSLKDLVQTGLAMRKSQDLTWAQLAMAANAPMLTKAAMVDGQAEVGILPTGQVVGVIDSLPTVAEVLGDIVTEAEATLERLAG